MNRGKHSCDKPTFHCHSGSDVAAFCDDLIKDSRTYADVYQESVEKEVNKSIKKATDKK